jgi:hypothetical protein
MRFLHSVGFGVSALALLSAGCSGKTPEQKLLGKWMGTVQVKESVDQALDAAAQGQNVNPLARGAVRFLGQKLAEATMSVELDFRSNGRVFFRGNTEILGFPPDSDGTWEVSPVDVDLLQIRVGNETKQLQGKVLFRDKDEFTLKLDAPPMPSDDKAKESKEGSPKATKELPGSIVFKRNKD